MCHSALEETCMGTESSVWIDKLHEQIKKQRLYFHRNRYVSLVWFSQFCCTFDFMPGKNVFMIIMLGSFFVVVVILFFQYVFLVSYLLYVSCTEAKGRYLLNNRGIFGHSVCDIQLTTQDEHLLVLHFSFENAYVTCHQHQCGTIP